MTEQQIQVERGNRHPLGATPDKEGVNFSIFSRNAQGVELLLFDKPDDPWPARVIGLDPAVNRTFFFWHIYVRGLRPGAHYALSSGRPLGPGIRPSIQPEQGAYRSLRESEYACPLGSHRGMWAK